MTIERKTTRTSVAASGSAIRKVPSTLTNPVSSTRPSSAIRAGAAPAVARSVTVPVSAWILVLNGRIRLSSAKSADASRKRTVPMYTGSGVAVVAVAGAGAAGASSPASRARFMVPCLSMWTFAKPPSIATEPIRTRAGDEVKRTPSARICRPASRRSPRSLWKPTAVSHAAPS